MNKKVLALALVVAGLSPVQSFSRAFLLDDTLFDQLFGRSRHHNAYTGIKEISKPGSDKYIYLLDVPGYDTEDLRVSYNESLNMVTISAENAAENNTEHETEDGGVTHSLSATSSSFSTSFTAPSDCALNTIGYTVNKGQMTITIDKATQANKRGWQTVTATSTKKAPAK